MEIESPLIFKILHLLAVFCHNSYFLWCSRFEVFFFFSFLFVKYNYKFLFFFSSFLYSGFYIQYILINCRFYSFWCLCVLSSFMLILMSFECYFISLWLCFWVLEQDISDNLYFMLQTCNQPRLQRTQVFMEYNLHMRALIATGLSLVLVPLGGQN